MTAEFQSGTGADLLVANLMEDTDLLAWAKADASAIVTSDQQLVSCAMSAVARRDRRVPHRTSQRVAGSHLTSNLLGATTTTAGHNGGGPASSATSTNQDLVSKALKVGRQDAWVVESHLSFDIPNLETKGELAIVVIIDTGLESASLYYASIPDTVPELVEDARRVLDNLEVDS